ncbi:MAG: CofH family radical SAM protein, partial [Bacteroidetes bacterium]|nr:CofH family radical SAM protein [Bacteroidota bacterium]
EVHITGAMPPDWPWGRYLDIVESIHQKFPNIDIKAYTAIEIDFFHKKFKMPVEEILHQLKEAGLKTMPGGGAEVFSERVRRLLFNQKVGEKVWLNVHKTAHRLGIPTNATMLYGHIETIEERLNHLIKLREAQDETGGFLTFIPLAFQPGDTGIKPRNQYTSAIDDLKTIAISRLMLDNFPHIKAYWVMLTEEVAAVALNFGVDDIDGTVGEEHIAHDAGALSPMKLAKDQLIKIIKDAGKIPVERDVFYNPLKVYGDDIIGKIPYLNSVPIYHNLSCEEFKILPVTPRRLGMLFKENCISAGLISLMDYFDQEENLELMNWCIATRDQVRSVLLFSNYGWQDLSGKTIGITDDTSTSVRLLQVLLEKKFGIKARFERMKDRDYSKYAAVLLIGDEALKNLKSGLAGFDLTYDLAAEWYSWQKLPFVFAVWVVQKNLLQDKKDQIAENIGKHLSENLLQLDKISNQHGKNLGFSEKETVEYLEGFNYRLGERERETMRVFREMAAKLEPVKIIKSIENYVK